MQAPHLAALLRGGEALGHVCGFGDGRRRARGHEARSQQGQQMAAVEACWIEMAHRAFSRGVMRVCRSRSVTMRPASSICSIISLRTLSIATMRSEGAIGPVWALMDCTIAIPFL